MNIRSESKYCKSKLLVYDISNHNAVSHYSEKCKLRKYKDNNGKAENISGE